jgi:hypothetical protein
MNLPNLTHFKGFDETLNVKRVLICAEGFEDRSLAFISSLPGRHYFSKGYIIKNLPIRRSRLDELLREVKVRTSLDPIVVEFPRFDPVPFEYEWAVRGVDILVNAEEIVIDISVMSKLLICMLLQALKSFEGRVVIIYAEPVSYAPSQEEYEQNKDCWSVSTCSPTLGVHDIIRVPSLSSVVSQRRPTCLVAFTSFNEQLCNALLASLSPNSFCLINGVPPRFNWRARAMQHIHRRIIIEFSSDNPLDSDGDLMMRTSTLDYRETLECLIGLYKKHSTSSRVVIAPTGSKMQAVACGIMKVLCHDIHIEYPTPESFNITSFSSHNLTAIHQIDIGKPIQFFGDLRGLVV